MHAQLKKVYAFHKGFRNVLICVLYAWQCIYSACIVMWIVAQDCIVMPVHNSARFLIGLASSGPKTQQRYSCWISLFFLCKSDNIPFQLNGIINLFPWYCRFLFLETFVLGIILNVPFTQFPLVPKAREMSGIN